MKGLVFDLETTGLISPHRTAAPKDITTRVLEIGWILFDLETYEIIKKKSYLLQYDDVKIEVGAQRVHGITKEMILTKS